MMKIDLFIYTDKQKGVSFHDAEDFIFLVNYGII